MGTEPAFGKLLAWAYRGEVSGETLFAELAELFAKDGHRSKLEVLSRLERAMARALSPLLVRYGVDGGDDERSRQRGCDNAAVVAAQGWRAFLEQFGPVTENALRRYRALVQSCPDGTNPTFDLLIAHEEALQAFAAAELSQAGDQALEPVNVVLARLTHVS